MGFGSITRSLATLFVGALIPGINGQNVGQSSTNILWVLQIPLRIPSLGPLGFKIL